MTNPLVSVVMITYGHEKYISEAIKGVFMQKTDFPVEFIIANDHSPDSSDAIIQELIKSAPQNFTVNYHLHERNMGMMPNFIWAIQQAKGKFIALCEGDDYWIDENKLQKQVDFLQNNPIYSIHSGHAYIENGVNEERIIGNSHHSDTYSLADFYSRNHLISCTVMFRKIELNSRLLSKVYFGDWMLYTYILNSCPGSKAFITDDCFSFYRVHESGAMAKLKGINHIKQHLIQILQIQDYLKPDYSNEDVKRINSYSLQVFISVLKSNNYKIIELVQVVYQNFKLVKFKLPVRMYLSAIRYRNV